MVLVTSLKKSVLLLSIPFLFLYATFGAAAAPAIQNQDVSGAQGSVAIDDQWRLWLDPSAPWRDDTLYLPDEVDLSKLPVNAPTGGWDALNEKNGIPVTLPGTVEEHYADKHYQGVSWWYRNFSPPPLRPGEHLMFSFPGGRLRVEVYVNGQLVGYNLIGETPMTVDATTALKPGDSNVLAVRVTNPGGNYDWVDYESFHWGKYEFPLSHGFGGLNGGVTMAVQGPVAVTDLAVLNHPDPKTVTISAEVTSTDSAYNGPVALNISRNGKEVWSGTATVHVPANGTATVSIDAKVDNAELWDIGHPVLYLASAKIASTDHSDRSTVFGFRWFTAEGIGDHAKLTLNGRRVVIRSSISWGFWAPNGMFPDQAAADREVAAVHAIGLNAIQNHRHMPKPVVLDAFDRAGIFRYCEPGAGCFSFTHGTPPQSPPFDPKTIDTSGKGGDDGLTFYNRYERAKILAMVRAYRSHPSVLLWTIQNEMTPDLTNPKLYQMFRLMHAIDPSRIIIAKSGIEPDHQALMLPYSDDILHDDGSNSHFSGWWDHHNAVDSQGVYQDEYYKSPTEFKYRIDDPKEIVAWGEMATSASPDDSSAIAKWYQDNDRPGYNRADAEAKAAAYEKFIDTYGFRTAFPTASALFKQAGNKHFFIAARLMENARICNKNDYIVLSGWESTSVENHSGLTDSLRNPKGDPISTGLHQSNAPALLVVRPRFYVVAKGKPAVVDVHLVNEINLNGDYTLDVHAEMTGDDSKSFFQKSFPVKVTGGDTFGELLKDNISFDPPAEGPVTITATLTAKDDTKPALTREEPLYVVDTNPAPIQKTVAVVDHNNVLVGALKRDFGIDATPLASAPDNVDTILVSSYSGDPKDMNWDVLIPTLIDRANKGSRVVLLTTDAGDEATHVATALAKAGVLKFNGMAGHPGMSWMGYWYFGRKHWLLDGLPSDCVFDWQYQASAGGNGFYIDAPGLEGVIGYDRDHQIPPGLGAAVIPVGKGQIVLCCLLGLDRSFVENDNHVFQAVTAKRLIYNMLH